MIKKSPVEIKDTTDDLESFEDDLSSILRDESDADIVELLKVPFIYYVSICIAQNLI